jgi:hypothetical protein
MKFNLLPITDVMVALYRSPANAERFTEYMNILQGNSPGDIAMPVTFFNPMGKEHVLKKLLELKELDAEGLIQETLTTINKTTASIADSTEINVSLALADDMGGGWTNRYTTDYDSKFNINDLLKRNFCNPVFWVSEDYSATKIKERTADYCYRILYRLTSPQPITLEDHIQQEIFVAKHNPFSSDEKPLCDFNSMDSYYNKYKGMNQSPTIFNFLYGDDACKELGHAYYGVKHLFAGYSYAKLLAHKWEKSLNQS